MCRKIEFLRLFVDRKNNLNFRWQTFNVEFFQREKNDIFFPEFFKLKNTKLNINNQLNVLELQHAQYVLFGL